MISDNDMVPIELCLLKPVCAGHLITPAALQSQWLELHDRTAWLFRSGHALAQGAMLAGFLPCWKVMEN